MPVDMWITLQLFARPCSNAGVSILHLGFSEWGAGGSGGSPRSYAPHTEVPLARLGAYTNRLRPSAALPTIARHPRVASRPRVTPRPRA